MEIANDKPPTSLRRWVFAFLFLGVGLIGGLVVVGQRPDLQTHLPKNLVIYEREILVVCFGGGAILILLSLVLVIVDAARDHTRAIWAASQKLSVSFLRTLPSEAESLFLVQLDRIGLRRGKVVGGLRGTIQGFDVAACGFWIPTRKANRLHMIVLVANSRNHADVLIESNLGIWNSTEREAASPRRRFKSKYKVSGASEFEFVDRLDDSLLARILKQDIQAISIKANYFALHLPDNSWGLNTKKTVSQMTTEAVQLAVEICAQTAIKS